MPVTKLVENPDSPANAAIGGVPAIHYFDFASKGRGEVLRLFLEHAGAAFHDVRYQFAEINDKSIEERAAINPVGSVPYVMLADKTLTQSYPILRLWARQMGKYDGTTDAEKYFVDVCNDLALDWRTVFVNTAFVTDKNGIAGNPDAGPFAQHKNFNLPKYVKGVEGQLASSPHAKGGPFVLGTRITYADFVIYQIYHDEREVGGKIEELLATSAPRLKALVDAVAAEPNVAAYFKSDRYFN